MTTKPTFRELAAALGCNPGSVHRWQRKGMPVDSIEGAKAWHSQHAGLRVKTPAKHAETHDDGSFSEWRRRRERAVALQAERSEQEQAGRLVSVERLRLAIAPRLVAAKEIALSVGARLAPVLAAESDIGVIARLVDDEMRRMLEELSGARDDLGKRA